MTNCHHKMQVTLLSLATLVITICNFGSISASEPKSGLNRLLLFTVATDISNDGFQRFNRSLSQFGHELVVLGTGQQLRRDSAHGIGVATIGGGLKLNLLKQALANYANDKDLLVMYTDSYDVIINGYADQMVSKFIKFDANILFSAQIDCQCDKRLESSYPPEHPDGGQRFLSSSAFMGYASHLFELLTSSTGEIDDAADDQLLLTKAYLNEATRDKHKIKLDHKSEIFQNLLAAQVILVPEGDEVALQNTEYMTTPLVVHGNGNTEVTLNWLGNYLGKAWSPKFGCVQCNESTISLTSIKRDDDKPSVLVAIFIEQATPFLDDLWATITALEYPKQRMHILLHNAIDYHSRQVEQFIDRARREPYQSIRSIAHKVGAQQLTEWQARTIGLEECKKINCDYYLSIDSVVRLDNPKTLAHLIELNRTVVAPMVVRPNKLWSNYWGALDEDQYYARAPDYVEQVKGLRRGVWNVPHVMNVYLINGKALQRALDESNHVIGLESDVSSASLAKFTYHTTEPTTELAEQQVDEQRNVDDSLEASIAFSRALRLNRIFQYVTNMHDFGHLIDPSTYNISRTHPDFYELASNRLDWERHYIHENYTKSLDDDYEAEEPCQDVYWFPLVSEKFCSQLIAIMETFGQWSGGSHNDPRIEGGYESVPTRDIHFRQVGLHDQWLSFLRQYVLPLVLSVYTAYDHDPPRAELAFVVRYHPAEQPSLRPHHDASTYTLNIALNKPGIDYQGGGCKFMRYNCSITESRLGWTLIHPGRLTHLHEGLPVTNGTRYIMVSFVDP